jgi:uncharacterized protein
MIVRRVLLLLCLLFAAAPAAAQTFPKLTSRVVDAAVLLAPAQRDALEAKLAGTQLPAGRQVVVATLPDLQGYDISDFGVRLGRAWGIGQKEANNGVLLLVAKSERKVRIEVGYGLEGILPDILASQIIDEKITPAFKSGDYAAGINGGVDAIVEQLKAPPEGAESRIKAATQRVQQTQRARSQSHSMFPLFLWGAIIFFFILPMFRKRRKVYGRRYGRSPGVFLWGSGLGGWGGGGGWGSGGGGGWGGGGFGGGGGFSGGGGSFGGGGASGSW